MDFSRSAMPPTAPCRRYQNYEAATTRNQDQNQPRKSKSRSSSLEKTRKPTNRNYADKPKRIYQAAPEFQPPEVGAPQELEGGACWPGATGA